MISKMFQFSLYQYTIAIASIFLTYSIYYGVRFLVKFIKIAKAVNKFPMDPKHWLYGHIHLIPGLGEDCLQFYRDRILRHPRIVAFWIGNWFRPDLNVHHPDTIRQLLKTAEPKSLNWGAYKYGRKWIGDGLVLASGDKWVRNRKLLTNVFHFDMLREYLDIENDRTEVFLDKLLFNAEDGTSIEIYSKVSLLTFDIILRCAFSYESDVQIRGASHPYLKAVNELQDLWMKRCHYPLQHFDCIYRLSKDYRKFRENADFVHSITEDIIKKKKTGNSRSSLKSKKDFLDVLLSARDENGNGLTDAEIRDEADTFLAAGHDTTASAISWTLYELAQNPQCQKKCQVEIDNLFNGRTNESISGDDLHRLNYLTMCIKEALRAHCPLHVISRELENSLDIDGVEVPEGTPFTIHIYGLHHNPAVWKDPMKYDPDRFSADNITKIDHFAFVPFSAGPRNCIGQNFAMDEIKVVVAKTLRRFTLTNDPDHKTEHKMGLVMKTKNGMYLKICKRQVTHLNKQNRNLISLDFVAVPQIE